MNSVARDKDSDRRASASLAWLLDSAADAPTLQPIGGESGFIE